jgi:hypothetical protein
MAYIELDRGLRRRNRDLLPSLLREHEAWRRLKEAVTSVFKIDTIKVWNAAYVFLLLTILLGVIAQIIYFLWTTNATLLLVWGGSSLILGPVVGYGIRQK